MSDKNASYPEQSEPTPVPHTPMVYEDEEEKISFEYRHIERNLEKHDPLNEKELNEFGKKKWELVSAFCHKSTAHYYFRRLKNNE